MYKPIEIADGVYSVGCRDWDIRDFHGYSTYEGTTYNAFLLTGEKNILIDTVKEKFGEELLANISRIIDPKEIDIVIRIKPIPGLCTTGSPAGPTIDCKPVAIPVP